MTTTSTTDILVLLDDDHRAVEEMLGQFDDLVLADREHYFWTVVAELVAHEVAEELVVYPAIRSDAPDGDAQADARIKEQSEAEEKLAEMEKIDRSSVEFVTQFAQLRSAVLAHAQAEEDHIFPILRSVKDPSTRIEMGAKYEKAKAKAPTHPHPNAPDTPPGNKVLGPIAALFDRARDAARRD